MTPARADLDAILAEAGVRETATTIDVPPDALDRLAGMVWAARRGECAGFVRRKPTIVPDLNLDTGSPLQ